MKALSCVAGLGLALLLAPVPALAGSSLLYVTNHAADTTQVVDTATNKIVQVLHGTEIPHGVGFSPDGARVYFSNESESALDVVDRKTGKMIKRVPLSGHPNNIAVTQDGGRVVVCIADAPGAIDIVDTKTLTRHPSIVTEGTQHNIYVTPDGKYSYSGSTRTNVLTVVDLASEKIAWTLKLGKGIRPMTADSNPDGSTRNIYAQLSELSGFAVIDFAGRKETQEIKFPHEGPIKFGIQEKRQDTPSHGIGVAPDNKTLWVTSIFENGVFAYSLPDLKLLGKADLPTLTVKGREPIGALPNWVAFRPDSQRVYVANTALNSVSVIDAKKIKRIADIKVGEVPQRMNTLALQ
jgi:YVTN family beta-propeller protein